MAYRLMGWFHMRVVRAWGSERGQGTVEYVALILLVAMVMAAVAGATTNRSEGLSIAKKVTDTLKSSIDKVGK